LSNKTKKEENVMDKKLVLSLIAGVAVGWIGKSIYDSYKAEGKIKIDVEQLGKAKELVGQASHAMNAVSNLSKEVRLS
jgi:hypothetical protein